MSQALTEIRGFKPGTTGWSVDDLDDPAGRDAAVLKPGLFPGLDVPLAFLWSDAA